MTLIVQIVSIDKYLACSRTTCYHNLMSSTAYIGIAVAINFILIVQLRYALMILQYRIHLLLMNVLIRSCANKTSSGQVLMSCLAESLSIRDELVRAIVKRCWPHMTMDCSYIIIWGDSVMIVLIFCNLAKLIADEKVRLRCLMLLRNEWLNYHRHDLISFLRCVLMMIVETLFWNEINSFLH